MVRVCALAFDHAGTFHSNSISGWSFLNGLDFVALGYVIVALFIATWAGAVAIWKVRHIEERWGSLVDRA